MGRRCSHCGNNGHNLRTCRSSRSMVGGAGLRLFGVQLQLDSSPPMNKTISLDSLCTSDYSASVSSSLSSSTSSFFCIDEASEMISNGCLSESLIWKVQEKKKGVPWSEEEHRAFLAGLEKLGKGYWCGISRNFVITRTPTQVASHAQKYFLRQNSPDKTKRRTSLFDVVGSERPVQAKNSSNVKDPSLLKDTPISKQALNTLSSGLIDLNFPEQEPESEQKPNLPPRIHLHTNSSHVPDPEQN
ncbi:hypothetical protein KFK09_023968 [Dendrobium nobile]|uniref:MYB transcription factor n=1 Tax=Dendrobium nobile TaxID=94219 RepID=A0A8T3ACQ3_DENNO|nr:hypothetical protein KFK09_023968 [Dendrobium nobile]